MNSTYLVMSIPFIAWGVGLTAVAAWKFGLRLKSLAVPLIVVLAATAVGDNLIVGFGIVAYDVSRISGWRIGHAPLEDFLYAIVAVLVTASVWQILRRRDIR